MELIKVILNQNYFQYSDKYFQPTHGITTVSPVSSTLAEIYLQFYEELIAKHWMETGEITYYRRYIDDIIIFDQNKINEDSVTNYINNIVGNLEFKLTEEENKTLNYLDLSIHRDKNNLELVIYRKPTQTGTAIHFTSNHPL